jgi:hypothetical protein
MIDITERNEEGLSDILCQGDTIDSEDLNNLCYWFSELLEASLTIQWKMHEVAEHNGSMELKILSEGFDNIIKQCHHEFLEIKRKNKLDSNIGEELK